MKYIPTKQIRGSDFTMLKGEEDLGSIRPIKWRYFSGKQSLPESSFLRNVPHEKKSFSHELGPRGGIPLSRLRTHSYNDLKVLLAPFIFFLFDVE